jgi:hypothetical protein
MFRLMFIYFGFPTYTVSARRDRDEKSAEAEGVSGEEDDADQDYNDATLQFIILSFSSLRGTPFWWNKQQSALFSAFRCFGPPFWFLTLSFNDCNDLMLMRFLLIESKRPDVDPSSLDWNERARLVAADPIGVMDYFTKKARFVFHLLRTNRKVLGSVTHYWGRVEFQERLTAHLHVLIWVSDSRLFDHSTAEGKARAIEFVDAHSSAHIPELTADSTTLERELHALVTTVQKHSHTPSCGGADNCRFHFPKAVCPESRIEEKFKSPGKPPILVIQNKRLPGDECVNPFGSVFLLKNRANMDLQAIIGDPTSLMFYIVGAYCSKSEDASGVKKELSKQLQALYKEGLTDRYQILSRIVAERDRHRITGMPEAAIMICGHPLVYSNFRRVFICAVLLDLRSHFLKRHKELQQHEGQCKEIWMTDIIDKYWIRPLCSPFDDLTLYEFARVVRLATKSEVRFYTICFRCVFVLIVCIRSLSRTGNSLSESVQRACE